MSVSHERAEHIYKAIVLKDYPADKIMAIKFFLEEEFTRGLNTRFREWEDLSEDEKKEFWSVVSTCTGKQLDYFDVGNIYKSAYKLGTGD